MALYHELLARPRLSLISAEPDAELDAIARAIRPSLRVAGRRDVVHRLARLAAAAQDATADRGDPAVGSERAGDPAHRTLDLIGHSTADGLLQLGDWILDATRPDVTAALRRLVQRRVLPRLGIRAVRLLGCHTARPGPARATLDALAAILGVEVHGTDQLLHRAHYDGDGFQPVWEFLLVRVGAVPGPRPEPQPESRPEIQPDHAGARDVRVASADLARQILALLRRDAGAPMLGAPPPSCELALAADPPGAYRVAHVLLGGAFVRLYPDGLTAPGVVYPVDDAARLCRIIAALPVA